MYARLTRNVLGIESTLRISIPDLAVDEIAKWLVENYPGWDALVFQ